MLTFQDFKDSLNPFKPTKYIKARLKFLPFVLIIVAIFGIISFLITSLIGK